MVTAQIDTATVREHAAEVGEAIYDQQLKPLLEPACLGQIVAIHLPSRDYFLGHSFLEAADLLRRKYPNAVRGEVHARGIGQQAKIRVHAVPSSSCLLPRGSYQSCLV